MALTDKLTAIADAIRGKTGKTDGLTLDQMPGEIAGIQAGGGGIEPTASFLTGSEIRNTIASYPFKPKYKNELIIWNTAGEIAAGAGGTTPYAYALWIINGAATTPTWVSGAALTAPWADENYKLQGRYDSFSVDESGYLVVPSSGTWGFIGANNTCAIYEIPLPIGLEV